MKKKTNKTKKYDYVVNLSKIKHIDDINPCWAFARHRAGLPLSDDELADICMSVLEDIVPPVIAINICNCEDTTKNTPWYKRVWNWLTKPFKKNK